MKEIIKELNEEKGYAIFQIENIEIFKKLKDSFIKNIESITGSKKDINTIRKDIAKMSKSQINKAVINFSNINKNLSELMINSCSNLIKNLCGSNLFIQRKAYTTINAPGEDQAKQIAHYEMISGISPFAYILWAPLHDLDDEGGAYHVDLKRSLSIMKKEESKGLVSGPDVLNFMNVKKPPRMNFGQAIIFNPFVIHGNIPFKSNKARIACNVRFQSSKKPLLQKNTEFLKFYKLQ
tara:strand:+ start:685 stop:1395 length:711 start_codon:yes stop_codon:yes gene_type:complete